MFVRLGFLYRPPDQAAKVDDHMLMEIGRGCSNSGTVILGDFNLSNINWEGMVGHDCFCKKIIDCVQDNFLMQLVDCPA